MYFYMHCKQRVLYKKRGTAYEVTGVGEECMPVKVMYVPFEQEKCTEDNGHYVGYGIRALRSTGESWECIAEVGDISCSMQFVRELAQLCTRLELDPMHLLDVVEDAIAL